MRLSARLRILRLTAQDDTTCICSARTSARFITDAIAAVSAPSGNVRDRLLDDYVRGLLLLARDDRAGAESAFRAALYSMPAGYTRVNCDLAQLLLKRGRAREAIPLLQPILRGKVDASNYYVTHTEVHAILAQAWVHCLSCRGNADRLGLRDGAFGERAVVCGRGRVVVCVARLDQCIARLSLVR